VGVGWWVVKVLGWMKVAASWRAYRETLGCTMEVRILEKVIKLPKVFIIPEELFSYP